MSPTLSRTVFDEAYTSRTAPWVIGEPQPAIVALEERGGWIHGSVLDLGCGTGLRAAGQRRHDPGGIRRRMGLEELQPSQYRGAVLNSTHADAVGRPIGALVDLPAWLTRARRI